MCLDCQSAMNNYSPGWYNILALYWCVCSSILWTQYDRLATSFCNYAYLVGKPVVMEYFLDYSIYLVLHSLYYCSGSLHLLHFCWWMPLTTVLHCQALHFLRTTFYLLLAIGLLLGLVKGICFQVELLFFIIESHGCFFFDNVLGFVTKLLVCAVPHPFIFQWCHFLNSSHTYTVVEENFPR